MQLNFDNRFLRELPADTIEDNYRRQVTEACYSMVSTRQVTSPRLIAHSREVAELLGLSEDYCCSKEFVQIFSGNSLMNGMQPYATCYGGHQFGEWAGQLGDGRAINLGDVINSRGERWALQLKGAGPTPYARNADGLAVVRSSIREFLCSEAMFHLGIPTTRALSIISTGETVVRDMFYDGNPQAEMGAVVCRVAPSFTRFGHFQIFAARDNTQILKQLVDYTLRTDFPHLDTSDPNIIPVWFKEICRSTAKLIVEWQRVGFVHGVMNTDNMSILGLTIDYGPYGWLENYDPRWTPNTTDAEWKRYCYGRQPAIAHWNLGQLANALYMLSPKARAFQEGLEEYLQTFDRLWTEMMAAKLGLIGLETSNVTKLIEDLFKIFALSETDWTIFFRELAKFDGNRAEPDLTPLRSAFYEEDSLPEEFIKQLKQWLAQYSQFLKQQSVSDPDRQIAMNQVNPKYVLRNYLAQLAIDKAEQGDNSQVIELLELLRQPYAERPEFENYYAKRPEWARHRAGCSMLSCSS